MNYRIFFLTLIAISFINTAYSNSAQSKTPFDISEINININNNTSPVSLTDFGTKKVDEKSFILFWEIPNDVNFSHFEIEESHSNNKFQVIETVTYLDRTSKYFSKTVSLDSNDKFYRLKMISLDGVSEYSDLLFVNKLVENTFTISPIVSSYNMVNINAPNPEEFKINIYAISGDLLNTHQLNSSSSYQIELPKAGGNTLMFEIIKGDTKTTIKIFR